MLPTPEGISISDAVLRLRHPRATRQATSAMTAMRAATLPTMIPINEVSGSFGDDGIGAIVIGVVFVVDCVVVTGASVPPVIVLLTNVVVVVVAVEVEVILVAVDVKTDETDGVNVVAVGIVAVVAGHGAHDTEHSSEVTVEQS
jgi:hypothetical protein